MFELLQAVLQIVLVIFVGAASGFFGAAVANHIGMQYIKRVDRPWYDEHRHDFRKNAIALIRREL